MNKIVITQQNNRFLSVLFDDHRPMMMETASLPDTEGILGNIYLARIKDIVPGICGAFLTVSNEQTVYLSLSEDGRFLCANRIVDEKSRLHQGDEIVIQITKEALKTKQPVASTSLCLTGQYCVCNYFGHGIQYSKKLKKETIDCLGQSIKERKIRGCTQYQFIIRTNVGELEELQPLFEEMESFIRIFDTIKETYQHRTCYSCLYHTEPEIIQLIKNVPIASYQEIVTDNLCVYELLKKYFADTDIRFYQDELLSLSKLYSLETHLKEALDKKVWLPCGGYLVIEPTEAMVVIDVNSGKTESKGKKSREYYMKVNMEAAKEVARQLRIRNYSGMIMVDFINMESQSDNRQLLSCLDAYLKEDKIRTTLVDMTALGVVEITRKKVSRPLSDFFGSGKNI